METWNLTSSYIWTLSIHQTHANSRSKDICLSNLNRTKHFCFTKMTFFTLCFLFNVKSYISHMYFLKKIKDYNKYVTSRNITYSFSLAGLILALSIRLNTDLQTKEISVSIFIEGVPKCMMPFQIHVNKMTYVFP